MLPSSPSAETCLQAGRALQALWGCSTLSTPTSSPGRGRCSTSGPRPGTDVALDTQLPSTFSYTPWVGVVSAKLNKAIQEREELHLCLSGLRENIRVDSKLGPCILLILLAAVPAKRTQYREGILDTPRMHLSSPVTSDFNRKVTAACRLTWSWSRCWGWTGIHTCC